MLASGVADVLLLDGTPAASLQLPRRSRKRGRGQGLPRFREPRRDCRYWQVRSSVIERVRKKVGDVENVEHFVIVIVAVGPRRGTARVELGPGEHVGGIERVGVAVDVGVAIGTKRDPQATVIANNHADAATGRGSCVSGNDARRALPGAAGPTGHEHAPNGREVISAGRNPQASDPDIDLPTGRCGEACDIEQRRAGIEFQFRVRGHLKTTRSQSLRTRHRQFARLDCRATVECGSGGQPKAADAALHQPGGSRQPSEHHGRAGCFDHEDAARDTGDRALEADVSRPSRGSHDGAGGEGDVAGIGLGGGCGHVSGERDSRGADLYAAR